MAHCYRCESWFPTTGLFPHVCHSALGKSQAPPPTPPQNRRMCRKCGEVKPIEHACKPRLRVGTTTLRVLSALVLPLIVGLLPFTVFWWIATHPEQAATVAVFLGVAFIMWVIGISTLLKAEEKFEWRWLRRMIDWMDFSQPGR